MNAGDTVGGGTSRVGLIAWRCLLLLAMIDALAWGLFWGTEPERLFSEYLGMPPRRDTWAWHLLVRRGDGPDLIPAPRDGGLWHLLALLALAQAGFLALAAWRPRTLGGLAVVPLIGHTLGAALWLWALGAAYTFPPERLPFPHPGRLAVLAAHDAVWLLLLLAFLAFGPAQAGRHSPESAARVQ